MIKDSIVKPIGRRAALGAMAAGCTALATGCEKAKEPSAEAAFNWEERYLPCGSVVHVTGFPEFMNYMIISRKPYYTGEGSEHVSDYAAVPASFGIVSDLHGGDVSTGETILFDMADIDACLHVGYVDSFEKEVAAALDATRDLELPATVVLQDIAEQFYTSAVEQMGGSNGQGARK